MLRLQNIPNRNLDNLYKLKIISLKELDKFLMGMLNKRLDLYHCKKRNYLNKQYSLLFL